METYKVKSLTPGLTDKELENKCVSTTFLSFERAIMESNLYNQEKSKVAGYKVTEQGILILWQ